MDYDDMQTRLDNLKKEYDKLERDNRKLFMIFLAFCTIGMIFSVFKALVH